MILRPWLGQNKPPLGVLPIPEHPLTDGLVGAWLLNEGSGGLVWSLLSPQSASLEGAAAWRLGRHGSAIGNLALQADRVNVGASAIYQLQTQSFVALVRTGDIQVGNESIVTREFVTTDGFEWGKYTTDRLAWAYNDGAVRGWYLGNTSLAASTEYVLGGTWSQAAGQVCFYVNGNPDGVVATTTGTIVHNSSRELWLGQRGFQNGQWTGLLYAVLLYNRVLSALEMATIAGQPYCWLGTPDLAAMWAAQAVAAGHPALRRLGLFDTGFGFDRSRQVRWG